MILSSHIFVGVAARSDWLLVMIYKLSWHDEISGLFKGYGFACFHNKVAALQARHVLEGQEVGGHVLDCGWLREGDHQVSSLDSKVRLGRHTATNYGNTNFLQGTKITF